MKARPAQAVLQVTDVAGYLAITSTRSLVWANDLESGEPLVAATVKLEGGASLGRTDGQGLLVAATSPALLTDGAPVDEAGSKPVLIIEASDGRSAFLPSVGPRSDFDGYGLDGGDGAPETFWQLLHTDRVLYRSTDTINAWGMIRERASGKVPGRAEVRLVVQRYDAGPARPALVAVPLTPGRTGAFAASVPLAGMPEGSYDVELLVDGRVITSTEVSVGPIAKPAYRLDLETGRRVYIEGDRIKTTVRATFFEGSPVPGVRLRVGGDEWRQRTTTTDRTGSAAVRNTARVEDEAGWAQQSAYATVARAEEGEITGYSPTFLVFPSTRIIDADAQVLDGQVRVTGSVHVVDVERVEREIDEGGSVWEVDPRGRAVAGATVTARFSEQVPIRRRVGTQYDFIAKEVVPVYEYQIREVDAGRARVKTDSDGHFVVTIPASAENDYRISVSVVDPGGHRARADAYATQIGALGPAPDDGDGTSPPILERTVRTVPDTNEYGVGETVDLTMRWSPGDEDDQDRFLFYAARSGLREATVSAAPRFTTTFDEVGRPERRGLRGALHGRGLRRRPELLGHLQNGGSKVGRRPHGARRTLRTR